MGLTHFLKNKKIFNLTHKARLNDAIYETKQSDSQRLKLKGWTKV